VTRRFTEWLGQKWRRRTDPALAQAYQVTFSTAQGQLVLQHLLDEIYCQTCPTRDQIDLATHNGRRSVVQEILENIDAANEPMKYTLTQEMTHAGGV
jgi:hypothetical protein